MRQIESPTCGRRHAPVERPAQAAAGDGTPWLRNGADPRLLLRNLTTHRAISGTLILFGLLDISGWLLQVRWMVQLFPGFVPVVFDTGLSFLLSGVALALFDPQWAGGGALRRALGAAIAILGALTLLEHVFDLRFGTDLAFVHAWFDYGNTRPGRMAPNTALGFVLIGTAFMLSSSVVTATRAVLVFGATFAVILVGLTGLIGYYLKPDLLFGWVKSARMALPTAVGMLLCGAGLWRVWKNADWYNAGRFFREDAKIRFMGSAIVLGVALIAGLSGFVVLQKSLKGILEDGLESKLQSNVSRYRSHALTYERQARDAVRRSRFDAAARDLLSARTTAGSEPYRSAAVGLLDEVYLRVEVRDRTDALVGSAGLDLPPSLIRTPLLAGNPSELAWADSLIVRTRLPLMDGAETVGALILDQDAAALEDALFDTTGLADSAEAALCLGEKERLACFPARKHTRPFDVQRHAGTSSPLPMEYATAGGTGLVQAVDYRGKNVLAAYASLLPGLGFVVKVDSADVYSVISGALQSGAPFILTLALLGALFIDSQLRPLAARLVRSEAHAHEKEAEVLAVMDAVGDAIVTADDDGRIRSLNRAACSIFGYTTAELIGAELSLLMPTLLRPAGTAAGVEPAATRTATQLPGVRKDGTHFSLEVKVDEVPVDGGRLFVGVLRDVTEHNEAQRRMAALARFDFLTGLPNRAFFLETLEAAASDQGIASGNGEGSTHALALLFLDLDGFKGINDTLGHAAGDELLVQFAKRLSSLVRTTDVVSRFGGDEFVILLSGLTDPSTVVRTIARNLVLSIRQPFEIAGRTVEVTASIGAAIHEASPTTVDIAALMHRADDAMYTAKNAGKNQFAVNDGTGVAVCERPPPRGRRRSDRLAAPPIRTAP